MSRFPKTRAVAEYAALHGPTALARARALMLLKRLTLAEAALAGDDTRPPATAGLLHSLMLAASDLAGQIWLASSGDDPDVAAFTALQAMASPPQPDRIDDIVSRLLQARFGPLGGCDGTGPDGAQGEPPDAGAGLGSPGGARQGTLSWP